MRLSSAIPSLKFIQFFAMHCLIISIAKAIVIRNSSVKVRSILYHTTLFKNRRNNFKNFKRGPRVAIVIPPLKFVQPFAISLFKDRHPQFLRSNLLKIGVTISKISEGNADCDYEDDRYPQFFP